MRTQPRLVTLAAALASGAIIFLSLPVKADAHCDTLDGPVVTAARTALEKGDVRPVLMWVRPDAETQIRDAFAKARAVRGKGAEAREIADTWFFETLVRVHRAGEGAPSTGLKPAGSEIDPAVALADRALESGAVDHLVAAVQEHLDGGIRERFQRAMETKRHAGTSVAAGREFVEAYVTFIHYVERLHADATSSPVHGGAEADPGAAPDHQH